jgi:protein ImuB
MFACAYVPDFPIQAALRNEDCDLSQPVAILEGPESLAKVFAVNKAARTCGIEIGMTRLQAEACACILLRKRSASREESAQAALLDCASGFSPRVESTAQGLVTVDLCGTESLLGPLQEIGNELVRRAKRCGFAVRVGIAGNPDTASHAARGFEQVSIIDLGQEALNLADLPLEVLRPSTDILEVLDSWGIRNCGSLAVLPPIPLVERLGQAGLTLQQLARGEAQRELVPVEAPLCFEESIELEESVELLEPLAFVLNRLLEQVIARLEVRTKATDLVRVVLELEIHPDRQLKVESPANESKRYQRELKLPVPTQDSKLLLKLLQLDFAAHPPNAPVKKVTLTAEPTHLRHTQTGLFAPLAPEAGALEIAIARLQAVVGEQDSEGRSLVGAPWIADSHRPDDFRVLSFRSDSSDRIRECASSPQLALRIFRPPLPVKVDLCHQIPTAVIFNGAKTKVLTAAGPWRNTGEWWDTRRYWRRDEWDLALAGDVISGLYRLFRDVVSGQWFVEGMYD